MRAMQAPDQGGDLLRRQDHGETSRPLRPDRTVQPGELGGENLAVKKEERAQRLVLGRRGDFPVDREAGEEALDVGRFEYRGVAVVIEADESPDPVDVGLLGPDAVVLEPDAVADLVEQAWGFGRHGMTGPDRRH